LFRIPLLFWIWLQIKLDVPVELIRN
jgi:hypothetical protein